MSNLFYNKAFERTNKQKMLKKFKNCMILFIMYIHKSKMNFKIT